MLPTCSRRQSKSFRPLGIVWFDRDQRGAFEIDPVRHRLAVNLLDHKLGRVHAEPLRHADRREVLRPDVGDHPPDAEAAERMVQTGPRPLGRISSAATGMAQDVADADVGIALKLLLEQSDLADHRAGGFLDGGPVGEAVLPVTFPHPGDPAADFIVGKGAFPGVHHARVLQHGAKSVEIVVVEFAQHQALGFKNRMDHGKVLSFWPQ